MSIKNKILFVFFIFAHSRIVGFSSSFSIHVLEWVKILKSVLYLQIKHFEI